MYHVISKLGLCNHFCSEKVLSITYFKCVFVALGIQHTKGMRLIWVYCHLWPVWSYSIFPHYHIKGVIFKIIFTEHKMCIIFSIKFFF